MPHFADIRLLSIDRRKRQRARCYRGEDAAPGRRYLADRGSNGHPQTLGALLEGTLSTFEDVAHVLSDERVFETTALIRNEGQVARPVRSTLRHDHLIRIGVHHQVALDPAAAVAVRLPGLGERMCIRPVQARLASVVLAFEFFDGGRLLAQPEADLFGIGSA